MSSLNQRLLSIDSLATGGNGVGRIDGKVCFVPYSAPGDYLRVTISRQHRSYDEAVITEVLTPSPQRVIPCCPYFGDCGGCDWLHVDIASQHEAKRQIVASAIQKQFGREYLAQPLPTIASPVLMGYRARAQFKLHKTSSGLACGFYRRASRHVVDLQEGCSVVSSAIREAILRLQRVLAKASDAYHVTQISLEEGLGGVVAIIHTIVADVASLSDFLLLQQEELALAGLSLQHGPTDTLIPIFGDENIWYRVTASAGDDLVLGYRIGSFSQVNRQQNQRLIFLVQTMAGSAGQGRVVDLFCGNGNLSLPLARTALQLTGYEGDQASIASAVDNADRNHIQNTSFECRDLFVFNEQKLEALEHADCLLLDPPRAGAIACAQLLKHYRIPRVVYVSCDPATLARDLAVLVGDGQYSIDTIQPLDMFPHTAHVETIVSLTHRLS